MKPLIVVLFCAATTLAQTPSQKTFSLPEFKVSEQSLRQAQENYPQIPDVPKGLSRREALMSRARPSNVTCLTMHSYNFDKSATPNLVSETNCTMVNPNGFLRVRR